MAVVRGIQIGVGLSLVISAGTSMLRPLPWVSHPFDNRIWAVVAFLLLLATQKARRFPYALTMFLVGLALTIAAVLLTDGHAHLPSLHPWNPRFTLPNWLSWPAAGMAVAQLPLSLLNSVISTSALAADLISDVSAPSTTSLGLSIAAMNLLGCWFGCMPVCHGAGGLAAQHRFGARSGSSMVVLGAAKILVGLVFGESLVDLLRHFPHAVLGVMVIAAGLELAKVGAALNHTDADPSLARALGRHSSDGHGGDDDRERRWTVALVTAAGILAFRNDAVGFLAGMLCHWAYILADVVERKRTTGSWGERTPLLSS